MIRPYWLVTLFTLILLTVPMLSVLPLPRTLATTPGVYPPPVPAELILTVRETAGVARSGEVVRSGVPLPQVLDVRDPNTLTLVDAAGTPVPAEFQVLARWNAGRTADAPIQWLLVTFPASVASGGSATYRLVTGGSAGPNPAPTVAVSVTRNGNQVTVNTGAATFTLGSNPGALFDEIRLTNGPRLISGGVLTARVVNPQTSEVLETVRLSAHGEASEVFTRRVFIEHAGPLTAIVVVEGAYDMAPVGNGGLGSRRRYVFTAGSPTAIVRQAVNWEGDLCQEAGFDPKGGHIQCDWDGDGFDEPNGLLVEKVRDALTLDFAAPWSVTAVGDFEAPPVEGNVAAGQSAWVRQQRRASRTAPLTFDVNAPGASGATGQKADGGMLAVGGASGTVAIALNHMHRYEPQALRLLADGRLAVDIADDQVWLGQRQGLFATLAVSVLPPSLPPCRGGMGGALSEAEGVGEGPGPALSGAEGVRAPRGDLDRLLWAPLNRPLRAWPPPEWFAASEAVDEFPVGPLPLLAGGSRGVDPSSPSGQSLADYDTLITAVLSSTLQKGDEKGLPGLMTFGVYPRYWGNPVYGDELDCGGNDPTPGEAWDDLYWCGTWTDYHHTIATAPIWAMRSGEVEWLDEIAFPGALRVLHTQIMQCAPTDDWFFCGQAPAGYGGYRIDFNSSHAYFDNLFLYYWLTGDYTVVEVLQRGASSMRSYLCSRRPAQPCLPDDPPTDEWAGLSGRVASQWLAAFRFVGLASDDASCLEDYQSGLARAVTQWYVEAEQGGTHYGFWLPAPLDGPGTDSTSQLWMASLYDLNNLYRLQLDTNDAPIGNPAIPPSQVLAAWARTLVDFGATAAPGGNGSAAGPWPEALYFTWSGDRIGGTLDSVTANLGGSDPYLYDTGKACLTALLLRAAAQTGADALAQMGADLTHLALNAALDDGSPLGKVQGLYLSRLHAAVARLAAASSPERQFPDTTASIHVFNDQLAGWDMTEAQFQFAATHYAGAQKMIRSDTRHLRSYNPNFIVLHYRLGEGLGYRTTDDDCNPTGSYIYIIEGDNWVQEWPGEAGVQDAWFFPYAGADRVLQCTYGWYLMELDDPDWRSYWMGEVRRQLAANENDGLFADSFSVPNYLGADTFDPNLPAYDPAFESEWARRIKDFIDYVQAQFAGQYYLIPNVGYWVTTRDPADYSNVDGVMIEGFSEWGPGSPFDLSDWQLQMNRILELTNQGKVLILQSYVDETDVEDRMFNLANYLLVKGVHSFINLDLGLEPEWFPEYEIPIGSPVDLLPTDIDDYLDPSGLYRRDYTNGLALVNPGPTARTIDLGGTYYLATPSGGGWLPDDADTSAWTVSFAPVTSVTLNPNRGAILLVTPCDLEGDLDGDGDVDIADVMLVASLWHTAVGDPDFNPDYDLDDDGDIDIVDIMLVAVHWGESC